MEQNLNNQRQYSRPYIDDIIIFLKDWYQQLRQGAGLTANPAKCE